VIEIDGVQHLATATNPTPVTEALLDLERFLSNRPDRAAATERRSSRKEGASPDPADVPALDEGRSTMAARTARSPSADSEHPLLHQEAPPRCSSAVAGAQAPIFWRVFGDLAHWIWLT
jgi:hypothetical protein